MNRGNNGIPPSTPPSQELHINGPHIVIFMEGGSLQMRSSFNADQTQLILTKMLFMALAQSTKPASSILKPVGVIPGN